MRIFSFALLVSVLFLGCDAGDKMQTTELGNRYWLEATGSGEKLQPGEYVYFHATMQTERDSVLFDTHDNPGDLPFVQAAPMTEEKVGPVEDVMRYMRVGDKAKVRLNIEEFPNKPPGLENDTVIVYHVEIMEIVTEEEFEERQAEKTREVEAERDLVRARGDDRRTYADEALVAYRDGNLENVQTTESGLKYVVHEEGTGPQATPGQNVTVQYIGQLVEDGSIFDQSFERGEGILFPLGQRAVIPGWDEGIALLKEGAKATFFIPSELAYGAQGAPQGGIPGGAELAFYVELEKVAE